MTSDLDARVFRETEDGEIVEQSQYWAIDSCFQAFRLLLGKHIHENIFPDNSLNSK